MIGGKRYLLPDAPMTRDEWLYSYIISTLLKLKGKRSLINV